MRPVLTRPAASHAALAVLGLALAGALPAGAALAQSGWVDPPARSAAPAKPGERLLGERLPGEKLPGERSAAESRTAAPPAEPPRAAGPEAGAPEPAPDRVAERAGRAGRQAERPERRIERHRRARRLADVPAPARAPAHAPASAHAPAPVQAAPVPPSAPGARPEPRLTGWAGAAQELAAEYFDAVSAPGSTIVASAPRFYADQVRFHGRTVGLRAVMAEKRDFARRWPERRYEPRGMRTFCNGALATCIVRAEVAFRAASPGRGALSQGVAEVVLEVSLAGPRPVIVSETSRVLHRGAASAGSAGPGRNA